MNLPMIPPSEAPKSKQINIRLTESQATELKRYCPPRSEHQHRRTGSTVRNDRGIRQGLKDVRQQSG